MFDLSKLAKRWISTIVVAGAVLAMLFSPFYPVVSLAATAAPDLGTAASFAILAAGGDVTLTASNVTGDVGLPAAFSYNPTTSNIISGALHKGDATYNSANTSFYSAYAALAASTNNGTLLAGATLPLTLTPGDYYAPAGCTSSNPTLTLDAGGDPNAVWVFRIGTGGAGALAATSFNVVFLGGVGNERNVFWWVKDAATMVDANFKGTILAGADISFTRGGSVVRTLAKGAVTLVGPISTFSVPPAAPAAPSAAPRVGGEAYPINKAYVLVPWLILALIVTGGIVLVLRRRTSR